MSCALRKEGNTAVLTLDGKLSLGPAVEEFRARWSDALSTGSRNIVINLVAVPSLDSSGIGSLIRCHSAVLAAGGKMRLVGAGNVVRQALKVTRLDKVFEFYDTEESALSSLKASA